ncbi:MAG TPA: DUF177 domain-containing protein [Vicinamibacterales bacterium]|jgi:uncharacterized protein
MQFDLTHLGRHGRGTEHVDRTYAPSAFDSAGEADDSRVAAPVHLVMDVSREGDDVYRVVGQVSTRLAMECSRCLEPFEIPVDSAFELRYVPRAQNAGEGEREIAEDDLTTAYYAEHSLDLEALMREQFQLALPMKPLCTEACKGLCPQCGGNLNTTTCDCASRWEDPRLAALKGLLDPKGDH